MDVHEQQIHVEESVLERYVLGKLPRSAAATISEHLFQCDDCFQLYEREVDLRSAVRKASADVRATPVTRRPVSWFQSFRMPALPAFGAAAAALLLLFALLPLLRHAPGTRIVAELSATRGSEQLKVKSGHALDLALAAGDDKKPAYIQVANRSGKIVWSGQSKVSAGHWHVGLNDSLTAGQYWVKAFRLVTNDQLREYPLTVE